MKTKKILVIIFMIFAVAINVLIVVESCIGGAGSESQSLGFTKMIVNITKAIFPNAEFVKDEEHLHAVVRKLVGHFLLFGLSGIFTTLTLLTNLLSLEKKKLLIYSGISLGFGLILASISEFIQYFVPGRAGMLTDILIDFGGYLLFAAIVFVVFLLISNKKEKEQ